MCQLLVSAVIECADAAHGLGCLIVADGAGGRLSSSCCIRKCAAHLRFLAIFLLLCLASLHKRINALGDERSGVP